MTPDEDLLVSCSKVSRHYGTSGEIRAVVDADCCVRRGDRIVLSGRSGSGKSTLLHLLAGLERPTSGTVERYGPARAGIVFQSPSLHTDLSARENVAIGAVLAGTAESDAFARAGDALDAVGIGDLGSHLPDTLSAGQAQRVAIARVLAARPALVLADEPTGRLDRAAADRVMALLLAAADVLDAGLVVATHDETVASRLDDHWLISDGHLERSSFLTLDDGDRS